VRSHELTDGMRETGHMYMKCRAGFALHTVFSASNYDFEGSNHGCVLTWSNKGGQLKPKRRSYITEMLDEELEHSLLQKAEQLGELIMERQGRLHDMFMQLCDSKAASSGGVNSQVTPQEWVDILDRGTKDLCLPANQWQRLQPILAPADRNNSINFEEFLSAYEGERVGHRSDELKEDRPQLLRLESIYRHHEVLLRIFDILDRNQDGCISRQEWDEGMQELSENLSDEDKKELEGAEDLFKLFDFTGTGSLSINDFMEGARLSRNVREKNRAAAEALVAAIPRSPSHSHSMHRIKSFDTIETADLTEIQADEAGLEIGLKCISRTQTM